MSSRVVMGYYSTAAHHREGNGKVTVDDLDPKLCTHIIYAFYGLETDGRIKTLDPQLDNDLNNIQRFVDWKNRDPEIKLLVSVGGPKVSSATFSAVAAKKTSREHLAESTFKFLRQWGLDGVDIDWEYPSTPKDKKHFVSLLQTLKNKLQPAGLLLTVAVGATPDRIEKSYNVPEIQACVDYINLMTFDLFGVQDNETGHHAPLFPYPPYGTSGPQSERNMKYLSNFWVNQGAPKSKLLLGMPFYGRSFTLASRNRTSFGAPIKGPGEPGCFSKEAGLLDYNEMCNLAAWKKAETCFDHTRGTAYAYCGDQWVGYDSELSMEEKCRFVAKNEFGGVVVWSIDKDDVYGVDHPGKGRNFPLLRAIKKGLQGH